MWAGIAAVLLGVALAMPEAEAKRLGGGRTMGAQRNLTAPAPAAAPAKPAQPAAAPAASTSKWGPLLGGLALGGVLGALFAGNPILGTMLSALLLGMLAYAAFALVRALRAPRIAPAPALQYAGLGSETVAAPPPSQAAGLDLRAAAGVPHAQVPAGFDVAAFLRAAKENFIRLQMANDSGRLDELREVTTPGMYEALRADAGAGQQTDVVTLHADLLEVATEAGRHWASVRFSGLMREAPGAAPSSFEEVWNLTKPVDGSSGWLLAGIQQMH
jgi:predicted lipid-binding transport protein (Tim44 family)